TAKDSGEWVLPKGHVEEGEQEEQTALREVAEGTGGVARVWGHLPHDFTFKVNAGNVKVAFFLMELVREGKRTGKRGTDWRPIHDALERATHNETKAALKLGDELRLRLDATKERVEGSSNAQ